ncbi:MAG: divalent cation transporter [Pseudomonadales bacterium]|nr:divalent cation transporter [Pseudomonadales bacterium]RLT90276.1 MAG: divalent cation transporter [Ketobacter sp. GenoA1]RLT99192.1 MAG: divalent cation transporter [Ketobacter sp.]TNC85726.1 MAG: divalent cation transporter [Alcanivorax sp.]HAG95024.1 divalent cation transporter [Gammaproteobacteria bacterium]|tara:strand:- start:37188 stop:37901 length:714 start_codon:yes stop_codon:yes gene_type:complete
MVLLLAWGSGLMAFLGGVLARCVPLGNGVRSQEFLHGLVGFGGGILLAGVVFALLPDAIERLEPWLLAAVFIAGGAVFCAVDAYLSQQGGSRAQLLAMLMDFVPEAISLGAVFVYNRELGILLALFIGVQNLPEGFNAFREMTATSKPDASHRPGAVLGLLFLVSFLGPVAAATGYFLLQDHPNVTASIMAFAGGGILYLLFEDIAPQTTMKNYWLPPMGAVFGFLGGMIGNMLIGH